MTITLQQTVYLSKTPAWCCSKIYTHKKRTHHFAIETRTTLAKQSWMKTSTAQIKHDFFFFPTWQLQHLPPTLNIDTKLWTRLSAWLASLHHSQKGGILQHSCSNCTGSYHMYLSHGLSVCKNQHYVVHKLEFTAIKNGTSNNLV